MSTSDVADERCVGEFEAGLSKGMGMDKERWKEAGSDLSADDNR